MLTNVIRSCKKKGLEDMKVEADPEFDIKNPFKQNLPRLVTHDVCITDSLEIGMTNCLVFDDQGVLLISSY